MAKQSGLHQIRGKVGEHSYYKQSGIVPGLIRSINPAMSGRVKNGDEYANTRLNNAEFRNAASLASAMGGTIQPKYRPMILPFSQSKLTKAYLALIKETTGEWGQRNAVASQFQQIADALNATAKTRYSDMFAEIPALSAPAGSTSVAVPVGYSVDQSNLLASMGITGVVFKATAVRLAVGEYDPATGRNRGTFAQPLRSLTEDLVVDPGSGDSSDINVPVASASVPGFVTMIYIVVVAMPYRTIGGVNYTLQEHCTFTCVPFTFGV